jgi:hypothetical protein
MQAPTPPTDQAEADAPMISPENVRSSPNMTVSNDANTNRTVKVHSKAANRTLPFDLAAGELHLMSPSPSPPQAEDTPTARKKPRIEEPPPTTTDEAARKTASPYLSLGLPPLPPTADDDDDDDDPNVDAVTNTQPNAGASNRATGSWTLEEDAKLTRAVTNARKKKYTRGSGRKSNWTSDEGIKLWNAVQTRGDKDWAAIAVLVPGRTKKQCSGRWCTILNTNIDPSTARAGSWTADEDKKLKDAVLTHGGKDWAAVAALIPGRTRNQCSSRWHNGLDSSIGEATRRTGKWAEDEDSKLKDAVQRHGDKDWIAISTLVPGRTPRQCWNRWHVVLNPSIDRTNRRMGKWTADEVKKLKDAVQTNGGKNWGAIAALVPGRTKTQCSKRWNTPATGLRCMDRRRMYQAEEYAAIRRLVEDECIKLNNSLQTHGGKDWDGIPVGRKIGAGTL